MTLARINRAAALAPLACLLLACQVAAKLDKVKLPPLDAYEAKDAPRDLPGEGDGAEGEPVPCEGDGACRDDNPCNGEERCDEATHACAAGAPPLDGFVCGASPRKICLAGQCGPSLCGDGFVDTGAGEACEPPAQGRCSERCATVCTGEADCPDDGNPCNGTEHCDMGRRECASRDAPAPGSQCGDAPRRICVAGTCQESVCGDTLTDTGRGEECDDGRNGDPRDGCRDDCVYTCHRATQEADCDDGSACTTETCSVAAHTCAWSPVPEGTACRAAAGACDAVERCDGSGGGCPGDALAPAGSVCRAAADTCDIEETCSGTSGDCPADARKAGGAACDDGRYCTGPDTCGSGGGACGGPSIALLHGIAAVSVGGLHACALTSAGGVKCWGVNTYGQLGNGSTASSPLPVDVTGLTAGAVSVSAGVIHTCALLSGGAAVCWGNNTSGQLGDGSTVSRTVPVAVAGLPSGATLVSAGNTHTCAALSSGGVRCWGGNERGQLGDGSTDGRRTPVAVAGLAGAVLSVDACNGYTCALTAGGAVLCWGENESGQLGDGSTASRATPAPVTGLGAGVLALSGAMAHTCALLTGGTLACWGSNTHGELGAPPSAPVTAPATVASLAAPAIEVTAGSHYTCARVSGGAARCWGSGEFGKLGNGDVTDRASPVPVAGLSTGASAIAAGYTTACALMSTGGVKCWGRNDHGQAGDGTSGASKLTPASVACH